MGYQCITGEPELDKGPWEHSMKNELMPLHKYIYAGQQAPKSFQLKRQLRYIRIRNHLGVSVRKRFEPYEV